MNIKGKASGALVVGLLVFGLVIGSNMAANQARGKIERGIEEKLPEMIGSAKLYRVKVNAGIFSLLGNSINRIEIYGEGIKFSDSLIVDKIWVNIDKVKFNASSRAITSVGKTDAAVMMYETTLATYLKQKYPDIEGIEVQLVPGYFRIKASKSIVGLSAKVSADGDVYISEKDKLMVNFTSIKAIGLSMPGFAKDKLEKMFNPIFDAGELGLDINLKSVKVGDKQITLTGEADLNNKLTGLK